MTQPVLPLPGGPANRPVPAAAAGVPRRDPEADRLDTLIAATLFLMTAYVREGGSPRLAGVVRRHLEALADHADTSGVLGATSEQAADHWSALAHREAPARSRPADGPPAGATTPRRPWLRLVSG